MDELVLAIAARIFVSLSVCCSKLPCLRLRATAPCTLSVVLSSRLLMMHRERRRQTSQEKRYKIVPSVNRVLPHFSWPFLKPPHHTYSHTATSWLSIFLHSKPQRSHFLFNWIIFFLHHRLATARAASLWNVDLKEIGRFLIVPFKRLSKDRCSTESSDRGRVSVLTSGGEGGTGAIPGGIAGDGDGWPAEGVTCGGGERKTALPGRTCCPATAGRGTAWGMLPSLLTKSGKTFGFLRSVAIVLTTLRFNSVLKLWTSLTTAAFSCLIKFLTSSWDNSRLRSGGGTELKKLAVAFATIDVFQKEVITKQCGASLYWGIMCRRYGRGMPSL